MKLGQFRTRAVLAIAGFMLAIFGCSATYAITAPKSKISAGLKVYPVKVDAELVPGRTETTGFTVVNTASNRVDVVTGVQDFVRNERGDYKFFKPGQRQDRISAAAWIKVKPKRFSLAPGQAKSVSLSIEAPEGAEPGGHFAMVFATGSPRLKPGQSKEGIIIANARLGVMIRATVPGKSVDKARLSEFSTPRLNYGGPVKFSIVFANRGNIHKDIGGSIEVEKGGKQVAKLPIDEWTSLPGSDLRIAKEMSGQRFGIYRATALIVSRDGKQWQRSTTFYVLPIRSFAIVIGIIIAALAALKFLSGRYAFKVEKKTDTQR
jgi:hypothetical protein